MAKPSRVRVTGPLAGYAEGYRGELARLGYRPNSARIQLQLMAHLSRWIEANDAAVEDLTGKVEEFLADRRAEGYTKMVSPRALGPLLAFLREQGAIGTVSAPAGAVSEVDQLLADYRSYLVSERGLAERTITNRLQLAKVFLVARSASTGEGLALRQLTAGEVCEFALAECSSQSVGSAGGVVCCLRSLLRYLYVSGLVDTQLDAAVPSVFSGRQRVGVPVSFGPEEVERLFASCDRRSQVGRRDYAVLCLLARLGMRAGEVAALQLADIDWHAGEIVVRGKGPRAERLPLPADVGDAIAGWLKRGRPVCNSATVITRIRAPHGPLTPGGVSDIVARACERAGLPVAHAHRLRHAAATRILQTGASLTEVAQVLRHTLVSTTAMYAKVDYDRLTTLALPWPQVMVTS